MCKSETLAVLLLPLCLTLSSCGQGNSTRLDYQMGEKISLGTLTYNVIQTAWRNQLGEGFKVRSPQNRFLLINISVTNGGGKEVALPLFKLEDDHEKLITESDNTEGVPDGIGILRSSDPGPDSPGRFAVRMYPCRLINCSSQTGRPRIREACLGFDSPPLGCRSGGAITGTRYTKVSRVSQPSCAISPGLRTRSARSGFSSLPVGVRSPWNAWRCTSLRNGPMLALDYDFLPGETAYFSCRIAGFQPLSEG